MSKTKKIILLGYQGTGKTTFYRKLVKEYAFKQAPAIKISPLVNYAEHLVQFKNNCYFLIDTPSFLLGPHTEIEKAIQKQTEELMRKNLIEQKEYQFSLFQRLGQTHLYPFSLQKTTNLEEVMEKIISLIPSSDLPQIEKDDKIKLTIFGPPNSGKSTLLNYLLQKNRSLVRISKSLLQERQIYRENQKTFRQSDLVWVVIDATLPLTKQTLQIIHLAEEYQKPLIIIVNKADLIEIKQKKLIHEQIMARLKSLRYAPVICLSALQGEGINSLLKAFALLLKESQKQFTKREIAKAVEDMSVKNPFSYKGSRLKIYFAKHQPGELSTKKACFDLLAN
ncbi:24914_t:CDS:2 [Entrophospora sp. SA101]|nr:14083_t:CDS:2 [Entrophospora sp. SA101]CAJ0747060.1 24914_t:CDS:2 [Entrophospora sp. SA101]CAJ0836333.1 2065_t:CDS:2 [Entrophospora sp. SA101]